MTPLFDIRRCIRCASVLALVSASTSCTSRGAVAVIPFERDASNSDRTTIDALDADATLSIDATDAHDAPTADRDGSPLDVSADSRTDATPIGSDAPRPLPSIRIVGQPEIFGYPSANFRAWLGLRGALTIDIAPAEISAGYLSSVDVLIVTDLGRVVSSAEAAALHEFVTGPRRGSMLVLSAYRQAQVIETETIVAAFGMTLMPGVLHPFPTTEFAPGSVAGQGITEQLPTNGVFQFARVDAPAVVEMFALVPGQVPIAARYENGGRLYVSLDEWASYDVVFRMAASQRYFENIFGYLLRS